MKIAKLIRRLWPLIAVGLFLWHLATAQAAPVNAAPLFCKDQMATGSRVLAVGVIHEYVLDAKHRYVVSVISGSGELMGWYEGEDISQPPPAVRDPLKIVAKKTYIFLTALKLEITAKVEMRYGVYDCGLKPK